MLTRLTCNLSDDELPHLQAANKNLDLRLLFRLEDYQQFGYAQYFGLRGQSCELDLSLHVWICVAIIK